MSERDTNPDSYFHDNNERFRGIRFNIVRLAIGHAACQVDMVQRDGSFAVTAVELPYATYTYLDQESLEDFAKRRSIVARAAAHGLNTSTAHYTNEQPPVSAHFYQSDQLTHEETPIRVNSVVLKALNDTIVASYSAFRSTGTTTESLAFTRANGRTLGVNHIREPSLHPILFRWQSLIADTDASIRIMGQLLSGAAPNEAKVKTLIDAALRHVKPEHAENPEVLVFLDEVERQAVELMEARRKPDATTIPDEATLDRIHAITNSLVDPA